MGQTNRTNWYCAQIGAREHYAVPRVLHQRGQLSALYTDFWAGPLTRRLSRAVRADAVRSLGARFHPDLSDAPVLSWNGLSLWWEVLLRRRRKADAAYGSYLGFIEVGRHFATRTRSLLERQSRQTGDPIFFGYDTGALEPLEWCRENGFFCVVNQMDPNRVEVELVRAEEKNWPGWSRLPVEVPEEYFQRREREWKAADRVLVNSDFCREALVEQGVAPEKIVVVPLCYEADPGAVGGTVRTYAPLRPLRILFLGQVIVRKGIQYLMQAARLLEQENIQFDVVGPVGITPEAANSAPKNLVFHGRATRDQAELWYRQSDVFVLPTLSDGFALTQIEAMANGLPVVATPNCGRVVEDGVNGFVVPARNAERLAAAFMRYLQDPEMLEHQSKAALARAGQFSLTHLGQNLARLEECIRK